eukprot:1437781-Prorocentrum_lima.AAC.1
MQEEVDNLRLQYQQDRIDRDARAQEDRAMIASLNQELARLRTSPGGGPSPPHNPERLCAICDAPGADSHCEQCNLWVCRNHWVAHHGLCTRCSQ